jgi:hypothetical protein
VSAVIVENLEARALFSGFSLESTPDAFHLERLIRQVEPPSESLTNFGAVVVALGDIDSDGAPDFAVSAPGSLGDGGRWVGSAGSVHLFSGRSLSLIRTLSDSTAGFGSAMVSLGDVNADGVADLAIGSPSADMNANATIDFVGRVAVYSGSDGSVIWSRNGASLTDELGWALATAGDLDGDGVLDLMVGAPGAGGDAFAPGAGAMHLVSGVDGASLGTFTGEAPGDRFGHAVDGGIDVPPTGEDQIGDGVLDFMVGAPGSSAGGAASGRAYVIDGATLTNRYVFTGEAGDEAGTSVAILGIGTLNPGSLARFAVGLPGRNADEGRVDLYNAWGTFETPIPSPEPGSRFGTEIRRLTIADEIFGSPFFTVSAPNAGEHRLLLYAGNATSSGSVASIFAQEASSLVLVGDIDADGIDDAVAGFAGPLEDQILGATRVIPAPLMGGSYLGPTVVAASDNGMNFVLGTPFDSQYPFPEPFRTGYAVRNGELVPVPLLNGMPADASLIAVNNAGQFFGVRRQPSTYVYIPIGDFFFVSDAGTVFLDDAITHFEGHTPSGLAFVKLGNGGDIIFRGLIEGVGERGFVFRDGVLFELNASIVSDINDAGTVLGYEPGSGDVLLYHANGATTRIDTLVRVSSLNNDETVLGTVEIDGQPQLAIWSDGIITVLSEDIEAPVGSVPHEWIPGDIDDAGRILARFEWAFPSPRPPSAYPGQSFLYTPEEGFSEVEQHISRAHLLASGVVVFQTILLLPDNLANTSGAVLGGTASGASGVFLTAINQDGEAILLRRDGIRFFGDTLDVDVLLGTAESVVTYVDARDGLTYAVVRTSTDFLIWFKQESDGSFGGGQPLQTEGGEAIVGRLSTYTSLDGRTHIAGVSENGDVLIYYQTNAAASDSIDNWAFNNLNTQHLQPQGRPRPAFDAGTELTPYITPWGGMNIAGINTEGGIEVIWWSPGKALWDYDNLSVSAGTPDVSGRLSAFVAPWGGLHLAAIDGAGHLQSTWWAPGLTRWTHNDLTSEYDGAILEPGSLTTYVTDWEGLNIAGIDAETGEAAVYWWTPTTGGWITETIDLGENPELFVGSLESAVRGNNLNIFGTTQGGALVRLYWYPSQEGRWMVENVSESLALG